MAQQPKAAAAVGDAIWTWTYRYLRITMISPLRVAGTLNEKDVSQSVGVPNGVTLRTPIQFGSNHLGGRVLLERALHARRVPAWRPTIAGRSLPRDQVPMPAQQRFRPDG
jgi:hypothetical protein